MTEIIFKIYNITLSEDLIKIIINSTVITKLAKHAVFKFAPITGPAVNGVVASVIVLTLGQAEIATAEAIYTEKINPKKFEEIIEFLKNQFNNNKIIDQLMKFIKDNINNLKGKSAKEIISFFLDFTKEN